MFDKYETGLRAGKILINALKGKVKPTMDWAHRPMLAHTLRMGTDGAPVGDLVAKAKTIEGKDALAVTVFGGFPLADFDDAGLSVVVVTDNNQKTAQDISNHLADEAWRRRREFVYQAAPLAESVARAGKLSQGPILLIDHADNCASGRVRLISDGEFIVQGPMYTGVTVHIGKTVVLDTGSIQIVVIENNHEPFDLEMFRSVGIYL